MKKYFVFNGTISGGSYFLRSFLQSYLIWFFGLGLYLRAVSGYKRASALFKDDTIKILFTVNTVISTLLSVIFGVVFGLNSYDFSIFFIDATSIIFSFLFISSLIADWYLILKDSEIKVHSEGIFTKVNTPNTSSEKVVEPIDDNKTPKEVNKNLNPNNNNTLLYIIIGLLVAILVFVVLSNPESQSTNSNKRETIEREKIPREKIPRETITRKEIETNPVQIEQRVKPKPKPKPNSVWFRAIDESDDPFVEDYAYSDGVVITKNKNISNKIPRIKISRDGDRKVFLTGLDITISDIYDSYTAEVSEDLTYKLVRNGYKTKSQMNFEISQAQKSLPLDLNPSDYRGSMKPMIRFAKLQCCYQEAIDFEISFRPSGKKFNVRTKVDLDDVIEKQFIKIDELQINFNNFQINEFINNIFSDNEMFVKLKLDMRYEYREENLQHPDVVIQRVIEKRSQPGLLDRESYMKFNLSGSRRVIN
jgi:hypothetical protein